MLEGSRAFQRRELQPVGHASRMAAHEGSRVFQHPDQPTARVARRVAAVWPLAKVSERTLRAKSFINAVGHYFA